MAKVTVYISAPPDAAGFAHELRQAIISHGGDVVSSPVSSAPPPASGASGAGGESDAGSTTLPQSQLAQLQSARAFVAVVTPTAIQDPRARAAAQHFYAATAQNAKRLIVPVLMEPIPEGDLPEGLQGVVPVTGPYGTPELNDKLITETLRRLGLLRRNGPLFLVAALLALLLLLCCGASVGAPGGPLHSLVAASRPTEGPQLVTQAGTATATAAPSATPTGTGLLGQYFRSTAYPCCVQVPDDVYGQQLYSEVDPQINIRVNGDEAPDPRLGNGAYAIRWTGNIRAQFSETYTFVTHSDDGVRVWVNGQLLIDDWTTHPEKVDQGTIALTAGQLYSIRVDYYENGEGHGGIITLQWQSASQPLELVPQSALYPPSNG